MGYGSGAADTTQEQDALLIEYVVHAPSRQGA